jgi:cytidyltransferase-like protein
MIVGLTSGCFDLLHIGHLVYLQRCKSRCDKLIVAVDSNEMVKAVKGVDRPIIDQYERWELIKNLSGIVDVAVMLEKVEDLDEIAKKNKANKLFKHQSFMKYHDPIFGLAHGAELDIIPDVKGLLSTSAIIDRIVRRCGPPRPSCRHPLDMD